MTNCLRFFNRIGRSCASVLLPLLLVASTTWLSLSEGYAQGLDPDQGIALQSVAKYNAINTSLLDQHLESYGYNPPPNLQQQWNQVPAYRKIALAYKAAEAHTPGSGEKMLALLSRDLSQRYEGVRYEKPLTTFFNQPAAPLEKFKFTHTLIEGKIDLPGQLKNQIGAIAKYADAGALGGTQHIMKRYFQLSDAAVYDILSESPTHQDALNRGLALEKDPVKRQAKVKAVAQDLMDNYEGARHDPHLRKIVETPDPGNLHKNPPKPPKPVAPESRPAAWKPKNTRPTNTPRSAPASVPNHIERINTNRYSQFVKQNYRGGVPKFSKAVRVRAGFGGVIFGNTVTAPGLGIPNKSVWIPSGNTEGMTMGYLEITAVRQGKEQIYQVWDVLREDVYAATAILNDPVFAYQEGNAIGLFGIENKFFYPDSSVRWELVIHPAISHLNLTYALAVSDAMPIAHEQVRQRMIDSEIFEADTDLWDLFTEDQPGTWKISDDTMRIIATNNTLEVINPGNKQRPDILLTMYGFSGMDSLSYENTPFNNCLPALLYVVPEYQRLNRFARTLALLRWVKRNKGVLPSLDNYDQYIEQPHNVVVKVGGELTFWSVDDEQRQIRTALAKSWNDVETAASDAPVSLDPAYQMLLLDHNSTCTKHDALWERIIQGNSDTAYLNLALRNEETTNLSSSLKLV